MRKYGLLVGLLFFQLVIFGQQLLPVQYDTLMHQREFIVHGVADYSATSLENNIIQKIFYGGVITTEIKDASLARHQRINRFGADISSEVEFRNFTDSLGKTGRFGWLLKAGYYNYASVLYTKDLFQTMLYGNTPFLGDTAQFSGTQFSAVNYHKLGFGWIDKKTKSSVSFNLYGIQNYATGKLWTGEVYQSQNADSLRITLDAGLSRAVSPAFYKGIGMGVDVDLRLPVEWAEDKEVYFQFLFKNLGLAYTNQPIQRTTADTTFHFTGLTFEQLVGNTSKLTAQSAMDSLSVSSYRSGQIILLPGFIQAGKIVDEMHGDRFQGYYGIRIYTLSANVPLVYAGLQYKLAESFRLGVSGSYGGFSMFRAGLYSQYQGKHIAVGVGTEDVYGVFSKKARGESIIVRLRWCI